MREVYLTLPKMSPNIHTEVAPEEDKSHQAISSYSLAPKPESYRYFKKNIIQILEGQQDVR